MIIKKLLVLFSLILLSCDNEQLPTPPIEHWVLSEYYAKTTSCVFEIETTSASGSSDAFFDTLLGLNDETFRKTTISLTSIDFIIRKDDNIAMRGVLQWGERVLRLNSLNESLEMKIALRDDNTLILEAEGYPHIHDVRLVFKKESRPANL